MDEFIKVAFQCIGAIAIAVVTYVLIPAIRDWRKTKLTATQQEQLTFWVKTAVLWAKQWMQTSTGEQKKAQVMMWVKEKVVELGLPFTDDDIDKTIEAMYSTVKDIVEMTTTDTTEQTQVYQ